MKPAIPIKEFHQYAPPEATLDVTDGSYDVIYNFHSAAKPGRWVMSSTGWGLPPIDYITQQGPFQHGVNLRDFFLQPRMIQLVIEQSFCGRDKYWDGRADLLNYIRPNRQTVATAANPGHLRRVLSDGALRDLDVMIEEGPQFSKELGRWKEWSFRELLRFIAFNPVIYDPIRNAQSNWVIPNGAVNDTQNVTYEGTWEEYPVMIITGPLTTPQITNNTTGEVISLTYNIPAGAPGNVVTIDLTYGLKTVTDEVGTNLIGVVTTASDLATFHLAPHPEGNNGVNAINLQGGGAIAGVTDFEIRWFKRYIGI